MYKIKNLNYNIAKKDILIDMSFNIKKNNFLAIVGPNGCGKSTLMKTINKSIFLYKGSITLDDIDIEEYDDKELALKRSVLNQSFTFPYSFKAKEIIEMGLYSYTVSVKKKKELLSYIIDKLDIHSLKDKDYQNLSGGEQQKIQLARVVLQIYVSPKKEKYLFLDEPTLNLDIYYQYKILDLTKELITDLGIGVCAILHDLNQAYIYSNELIMIQEGEIKYYGKTNDILNEKHIFDIFKVKSDFVYSKKLEKTILVNSL